MNSSTVTALTDVEADAQYRIYNSTNLSTALDVTFGGTTDEEDVAFTLDAGELSEFTAILSEINNPGIHSYLIGGEAGIGKSRLIEELRKNLSTSGWVIGYSSSEKPIDMDSTQGELYENSEPFSIISQAFGPALGIANLAQRQATLEKASDTFAGFESSLSKFPGVGMLLEIQGNDYFLLGKSDSWIISPDHIYEGISFADSEENNSPFSDIIGLKTTLDQIVDIIEYDDDWEIIREAAKKNKAFGEEHQPKSEGGKYSEPHIQNIQNSLFVVLFPIGDLAFQQNHGVLHLTKTKLKVLHHQFLLQEGFFLLIEILLLMWQLCLSRIV